jgi:cobalt/nickel transport system permease protein
MKPCMMTFFDARSRMLATFMFSGAVALIQDVRIAALACALPLLSIACAPPSFARIARPLLHINVLFLLTALMTIPFVPGETLWMAGPIPVTREGLLFMALITLKGNAVVAWCVVWLGSMEPATLGHALSRLRLPTPFIRLLMSTIRYIDVLQEEYACMRMAMRARGFKPQLTRLSLRAHGLLVGALLLRSLERADRVADAMKCRGHHGVYAATETLVWRAADTALMIGLGAACALLLLGGMP